MIRKYLDHERSLLRSEATINASREILTRFEKWLEVERSKRVTGALEEDLEAYLLYRKTKGISRGYLEQIVYKLRLLYRFLHHEGLLLLDPAKNLMAPRREQGLKEIPTEEEVQKLLSCPDEYTYQGLRDKAMLELIYSSGIRQMELRRINLKDLDMKEGVLRVMQGKGRRQRLVPVGKTALSCIQKYIEASRPRLLKNPSEDTLFLAENGKPISDSQFYHVIDLYRKRSQSTIKISPHSLRHACALHMLKAGASIEIIRRLLGHRELETTQIYTRLCCEDLKKVHSKHHPREAKRA